MNAQVAALSEKFRSNAQRAQQIAARVGEARMALRPEPDSWSAAHCLAHLTLSTEVFLPLWRTALADARASGLMEKGPFKMDLVGGILTWVLEPPPRLRVRAPGKLRPVTSGDELLRFL